MLIVVQKGRGLCVCGHVLALSVWRWKSAESVVTVSVVFGWLHVRWLGTTGWGLTRNSGKHSLSMGGVNHINRPILLDRLTAKLPPNHPQAPCCLQNPMRLLLRHSPPRCSSIQYSGVALGCPEHTARPATFPSRKEIRSQFLTSVD